MDNCILLSNLLNNSTVWFLRNLKMLKIVYRHNYGMMTRRISNFFFPVYFKCALVDHTIYPCVCNADRLYIGIYGKMCTWIIICIRIFSPLTSCKYIQATKQSCWSEEFGLGVCNGDQLSIWQRAPDLGSSINIF